MTKARLIKDLGSQWTSDRKTRKRKFGLFECVVCHEPFRQAYSDANRLRTTGKCGSCCRVIHNETSTILYGRWRGMLTRCYNQKSINYEWYGGRGVTVCDEWLDFNSFSIWAKSNGFSDELEIDKDLLGDGLIYSPTTCCYIHPIINNYISRRSDNKTGFIGVYNAYGGKFKATIVWKGVPKHVGTFNTAIDAAIARETELYKIISKFMLDNKYKKIIYDAIKDKHTKAMRKHRQYKQKLYLNGDLINDS